MANHLLGKHFRLWLCFRLAFAANILHNSARRRSRRKCNALQAINNFHFFIKLCRSRRRRRQSANVDVDVDVNVPVCNVLDIFNAFREPFVFNGLRGHATRCGKT